MCGDSGVHSCTASTGIVLRQLHNFSVFVCGLLVTCCGLWLSSVRGPRLGLCITSVFHNSASALLRMIVVGCWHPECVLII
jgi:hypothetical protein